MPNQPSSYRGRSTSRAPQRYPSRRPAYRRRRRRRRNPRTTAFLALFAILSLSVLVISVIVASNGRSKANDRQTPAFAQATLAPIAPTETAALVMAVETEPVATQPMEIPAITTQPPELPIVSDIPVPVETPETSYQILDGVPNTDRSIGLPECPRVDDSYFDDAVFIGDSVTLKLNYYVRDARKESRTPLGGAQFLTAGSMGSGNALRPVSSDSLHPTYQGKKMPLEDSVAAMGAKKVFIMLGMNDIAVYGVEESAQNLMRLARRIKDKSPDALIFIQSATPRLKGKYKKLNNNALFEYDLKLYEYCQQFADQGLYFVDVAYVMRDAEGNLPANYCSDPDGQALHFTGTACQAWIDYLYTHALTQGAGI